MRLAYYLVGEQYDPISDTSEEVQQDGHWEAIHWGVNLTRDEVIDFLKTAPRDSLYVIAKR